MDGRTSGLWRSLVIAAVAGIVACAWFPQVQALADEQVDAGLKRALISFASARTLNGLISVLQGTELSVQPLGVGVTLTVGQALDPINDLIEQFSTLMLYASVAFGVQKALLAIGGNGVITVLVSTAAIAWAWLYALRRSPPWLSRALLVLLMIRFAIPVVTLGSEVMYRQLLADDYVQQQGSIEHVSGILRKATPPTAGQAPQTGEANGWWERLKDRVGSTVPEANIDFDAIKASVEGLPERIVRLIVIFMLQTMIIPIFLLWALYRVALGIARPGLS